MTFCRCSLTIFILFCLFFYSIAIGLTQTCLPSKYQKLLIFLSLAISIVVIPRLLYILFYALSQKKNEEINQITVFECGFTPYFYTRISISIHFFIVALIFLFFDLEICYLFNFFFEGNILSIKKNYIEIIFLFALLGTLIYEWKKENLNWKF